MNVRELGQVEKKERQIVRKIGGPLIAKKHEFRHKEELTALRKKKEVKRCQIRLIRKRRVR